MHRDDVLRRVRGAGSRSVRGVGGVQETGAQVQRNCYKGYPTRHEAVAKWRAHQANKSKMKTFLVLSLLLTIVAAVLYFILV